MSTPTPVPAPTTLQTLAQLEATLKADFRKDFGPDLSQLFIALENPGSLTPLELEVFDAGQLVGFGGKLASDLLHMAPDAQTALIQFLAGQVAKLTAGTAAKK